MNRRLFSGAVVAALLWGGSAFAQQINSTPPQALTPVASPTFTGLTLSGLTQGSVLFAGAGGVLSQDNANHFWDATNHRLILGATAGEGTLSMGVGSTIKLYNSRTDASNGEWFEASFSGNIFSLGTNKNGTGSTRNAQFVVGGVNKLDYGVSTSGGWTINTAGGGFGSNSALNIISSSLFAGMHVQAPASNNVFYELYQGTSKVGSIETDQANSVIKMGAIATAGWGVVIGVGVSTAAISINSSGNVSLNVMSTADPHVVGQLWNSSGTVHISAG